MAKINPKIFEKKITKKQKALKKVKQYGGKALKVLSFINPTARVGSLLYKAGRALYLRQQTRNLKLIGKRGADIVRRTPIMGKVVIQGTKGIKETKRAKIGSELAGMRYKYLTGIKRTKASNQKLIGFDRKIPGGTMKPADYRPLSKPRIVTNRSTVALARKRRQLRQEAGTGMALKIGITTGAIAGINKLRQPSAEQLEKKRQADMIKNIKRKKKKVGQYGITDDQYNAILEGLR